ncbi:hypothetical protein ACROYT_G015554 [Oculina patagonica]
MTYGIRQPFGAVLVHFVAVERICCRSTVNIVRLQDSFVLFISPAVRMNTQAAKECTMQNVGRANATTLVAYNIRVAY